MEIRLLEPGDAYLLEQVAQDVFDRPVETERAVAYLADPRLHLVAAIDKGRIVGIASGVDYFHPDKPAELWINEVAVAPSYRGAGLGKRVVKRLLEHGRELGCQSAWVLAERDNVAARRLYASLSEGGEGEEEVLFELPLERAVEGAIDSE